MNYVGLFAVVSLLNALCFCAAYLLFPQVRGQFLQEDRLVENLSAGLFFVSFLVGVIHLPRQRGKGGFRTLVLVTALGLLCFLEELSYGGRIFKWSVPEVNGVKLDALHDFFVLGLKTLGNLLGIPRREGVYALAGAGVVALGLAFVYRAKVLRVASFMRSHPPYLLLGVFLALGLTAQVMDLRMVDFEPLYMLEELCEMNAALALLFAALYLARVQDTRGRVRGAASVSTPR